MPSPRQPVRAALALLLVSARSAAAQDTGVCNVVGGGTLQLPECYSAPNYATWTYDDAVRGERRFFGLYTPPGVGMGLPVLIGMSDGTDVCRPGGPTSAVSSAARYGHAYVCAGMGRSRPDGAWEFGGDGVANAANPLPCEATTREYRYLASIFGVIVADTALDPAQVYTQGFSLNSMFAGYTAFCSQTWQEELGVRVRGVWQAGSGLKRGFGLAPQGVKPPNMPLREGDCRTSDRQELGNSCVQQRPCEACEYYPVVPVLEPAGGAPIRDCIMIYDDDFLAATATDMFDFLRAAAEHEPVLLQFTPGEGLGGHSPPQRQFDWMAGCLGIVDHCSSECERWFVQDCLGEGGEAAFDRCLTQAHSGDVPGCEPRCAPTVDMLSRIQAVRISTAITWRRNATLRRSNAILNE